MAALDAGHIHETGRTADERPAGKDQLGNRLPAAFGKGARSICEPFAVLECAANEGVGLEPLKFFEGRKIGILVIEMHHEAHGDEVLIVVVEE